MSKKPANNSGKNSLKAKIVAFFETRRGHGVMAVLAIAMGYVFVSWAIDTGSLFDWLIVIILTIIAVREIAAFVRLSLRNNDK